ncbi:hypothetical protein [Prosthecomicrobium sp. N25]|uniref:hypothetical protein n=1 Tax=Prosthecomicrobium sp. N25 TaxID=3129254 RepID=UPI00307711B2
MSGTVTEVVEATAGLWSGVTPPNAAAVEMTKAFEAVIAGFEALRGTLAFEEEPSSFEAALQATKE